MGETPSRMVELSLSALSSVSYSSYGVVRTARAMVATYAHPTRLAWLDALSIRFVEHYRLTPQACERSPTSSMT